MRTILIALVFVLVSAPLFASDGDPKLQVGKIYHAIYECHSTPFPELQLMVPSCYQEFWRILAIGKNGWLRILDVQSEGEQWVNINRLQAIREQVKKDTSPPPSHEPETTARK